MKGKPDSTKLAVRRLIANDAHIQAIGKAILDAAGYGENVEVENPTTGV